MNFFQRVYGLVLQIPFGKISTYGEIARAIGTADSRRVGHALHANKNKNVPCHRVVFKNGSLAPGYAFGGPNAQKQRLIAEGIKFTSKGKANLAQFFFQLGDLKHS